MKALLMVAVLLLGSLTFGCESKTPETPKVPKPPTTAPVK